MKRIERIARLARRRLLLRAIVVGLGPAMLIGASISFVLVMVNQLADTGVGLMALIVTPLFLAAITAVLRAVRRRPSMIAAAQEVDSNLLLADRLSTALAISSRDDPFSALALDAGKLAAATADVHRAISVRFGKTWRIWPLVVLCSVAMGVLLPQWSPRARREAQVAKEIAQRTADVAARVDAAIETAKTMSDPTMITTAEQIRSLEELRRELDGMKEISTTRDSALSSVQGLDDAVSRTAESMEKLAKSEEMAARESQTIAQEVEERLADLPRASTDEGTALSRAVRSGDLDAARTAASELVSKGGSMTVQERESVARDLQTLAEDLRSLERMQFESSPEAVAKAEEAPSLTESERSTTKQTDAQETNGSAADDKKRERPVTSESNEDANEEDAIKPASRPDQQVKELQRRLEKAVEQLRAERREEQRRSDVEENADAKPTPGKPTNSQQKEDSPGTGNSGQDSRKQVPPERNKESKSGPPSTEPADSGAESATTESKGEKSRESEKSERAGVDAQSKKPGEDGARDVKDESARPKVKQQGEGQERGQRPQAREASEDRAQPSPRTDGVKSEQPRSSGDKTPSPDPSSKDLTQGASTENTKSNDRPEQRAEATSKSPEQKDQARSSESAKRPLSGGKDLQEVSEPATNPVPNPPTNPAGQPKTDQAEKRVGDQSPTGTKQTPSISEQPVESQRDVKPSPSGNKTDDMGKQPTTSEQESGKRLERTEQQPDSRNPNTRDKGSPTLGPEDNAQAEQRDNSPRETSKDGTRNEDMPDNQDAMKRLQEQIERMGESAQKAKKQEQSARTLRERANEMYRSASPSDQEKMQRWVDRSAQAKAQDAQTQSAGGKLGDQRTQSMKPSASPVDVATTPVDARKPAAQAPDREARDQVVAEWLGDGEKHRGIAEKNIAESRLQQAAESAEQAIGDRTVPSRYDRVLREYFKRLPSRVLDQPVSAPTPAAAPAMDAP